MCHRGADSDGAIAGATLAGAPLPWGTMHAEAHVDLDAIAGNVGAIRERVAPGMVMAVVKAGGYGHGAVPAARAALRGWAWCTWQRHRNCARRASTRRCCA